MSDHNQDTEMQLLKQRVDYLTSSVADLRVRIDDFITRQTARNEEVTTKIEVLIFRASLASAIAGAVVVIASILMRQI